MGMGTADFVLCACVFLFTAIGLVCDLKTRKLPNALTVPALCAGLLFHMIIGHGWLFALLGFVVGFGVMLALWFIGGSGGGDVKFMAAVGCWLGPWTTFQVLILGALISGVLTILGLGRRVLRMRRLGTEPDAKSQAPGKNDKKGTAWSRRFRAGKEWVVPFGVSAALAVWTILALECAGFALPWPPPGY